MTLCSVLVSIEGLLVVFCFATDILTNSQWFLKSLFLLHKRHKRASSILLSGNTEACCLLGLVPLSALGQLVQTVMLGKERSSLSLTAVEGQPGQGQQGSFVSEAQRTKRTYLLITNKCKGCGTSQTQVFLW